MESYIGTKYGRLTIQKIHKSKHSKAECLCECGNTKTVFLDNLKRGKTNSCGCLYSETRGRYGYADYKHGESNKTVEYRTWKSMKSRCYNKNNKDYPNYGGRGIIVCERWLHSYENFLEDIGRKPSKEYSIDRIDVNGNYEPNNCRWATPYEQRINQRV